MLDNTKPPSWWEGEWPPTWTCHVCGCERPDSKISVRSNDISAELGLPTGTAHENVRYCNDNPECFEGSKVFRHLKISTSEKETKRIVRKDHVGSDKISV